MKALKIQNIVASLAVAAAVAGCSQSESNSEGVDLSPQALAAAQASGYVAPKDGKDGGELHIYTWSDYIAPEVIAGFE